MELRTQKYWLGVSLSLLGCLLSSQAAAAEKVAARTVKESTRSISIISNEIPVIVIPESEFTGYSAGKGVTDPFFPGARYLLAQRRTPDPAPTAPAMDDTPLKALKITGVGGVGDKRWAMVNGVTLYLGEHATIQVNGKGVAVQCVEFTDRTVVLGIKGTGIRRDIKLD